MEAAAALTVSVTVALAVSTLCSLFEAVLYSARLSVVEAVREQGSHRRSAERFMRMKNQIERPTAAILILNTLAHTVGATLSGMYGCRTPPKSVSGSNTRPGVELKSPCRSSEERTAPTPTGGRRSGSCRWCESPAGEAPGASAQSNYHALLLRFERRFRDGLSLLSSYAFSKAISNAPQFRNAGGANGSENSPPQNSYDLRAERGLASFNVSQRWVNTFVYDLPFGKGKRLASQGLGAALLGGWQVSGIVTLQSGFPFTVNLAGDTAGIGGGSGGVLIRANAVPGQTYKLPADQRSTARWFNTGAFELPPAFEFGNTGRNTVIGPGMVNFDATVARNFQLTERVPDAIPRGVFQHREPPELQHCGSHHQQSEFRYCAEAVTPAADSTGLEGSILRPENSVSWIPPL